jgi:hypothetical protein
MDLVTTNYNLLHMIIKYTRIISFDVNSNITIFAVIRVQSTVPIDAASISPPERSKCNPKFKVGATDFNILTSVKLKHIDETIVKTALATTCIMQYCQ